jgi:heme O synthase-like polyprenyltransferase
MIARARRLRRFPGEVMRFFAYSNVYLAALFVVMALDVLVT